MIVKVVAIHKDTPLGSMSMEIHIQGNSTLLGDGYCIRLVVTTTTTTVAVIGFRGIRGGMIGERQDGDIWDGV